MAPYTTLPELLHDRLKASTSHIGFLDAVDGSSTTLSYQELFVRATRYAGRLRSVGLKPESNPVLGLFEDHENYIVLFWSCCLAGIPFCPLAALHPDPKRQADLFVHLRDVLGEPAVVTTSALASKVAALDPQMTTYTLDQLDDITQDLTPPEPLQIPCPEIPVCYVLTSGSTGKPKAVALRHDQILASCTGKSKHHRTSSSSRFLNWIAFDHVASIIEIHIHALLIDAVQYHISPKAIIAKPNLLLELSNRLAITYTFSPNFLMARLLKDQATDPLPSSLDLSNLRALISGGESVPMSIGVAFSNLLEAFGAPRDALRAGFGMSETCAGCIYDTQPIASEVRPDAPLYLHLGQCIPGMSMRVLSATGGACAPGEVGQLQLSGQNVFRGYVNNPTATREAFTPDGWFLTGDLGYLDAGGNLHLVGRDKDCLNINGTKVSSKDVETYLEDARIPDATDPIACPLRLQNADTETYIIFYASDDLPSDTSSMLASTLAANQAISDACTVLLSHAPHVVIPLPPSRFVKTALGKVSRGQLTAAYLRGDFADVEERLKSAPADDSGALDLSDAVQQVVSQSISDVLDLATADIRQSTNLFDTGASSMHLMRLKKVLEERLCLPEIPTIEILRRPRVGPLCAYLSELSATGSDGSYGHTYHPLVCLDSEGSRPPVFLIHPGVGEILVFLNMAHQLRDDRPVYAIRAKGFDYGELPFESLDETVQAYTDAIDNAYPTGPYYLAGYSYGSAIAFEIGKRLESKGKRVDWLGILNLPPHIQFRIHELTWIEVLLNVAMFVSLIEPTDIAATRAEFLEVFPSMVGLDSEPHDPVPPIQWLLSRSNQARLEELDLQLGAFTRWIKVAYEINRTGRSFFPSGCVKNALTTVFCAVPLSSMGTREVYKAERLSQWKDFSGAGFELVDVDGEHYTMLSKENSASFVEKMRAAMHRAEDLASKRASTSSIIPRPMRMDFDEVPVIDFTLAQSDPAKYYAQLRFALEDVGFLVFSNVPGFEDEFQSDLFAQAKNLFGRSQQWKDSLGTVNSYALRGYFRADTLPGSHKAHAEAYRFGADMPTPTGKDVPFWLKLHEGPNQWPAEQDLPRFREQMNTLFARYHQLNLDLNKQICHLLSLPEAGLDAYFPAPTPEFNCAIWHYFPVTQEIRDGAKDGFAQGMHEHRDPSTFVTCLIQSRPGLQVQNHQGVWLDVPMVKGGVVCNIGMQLMKLTGGKLVATTHRVNTLKIDEDRFTIPYVLSTRLEKEIIPLPQFASPDSAKAHFAPNPKIGVLMGIKDPLLRSGYARLTLFPAATANLYPKEFEQARQMGIV
ncbi:acetyl-CoA synthetase-like protein [Mycena pura]|uniref:Acetyl-CoA synthetase-like protein n=1 Tax=Mycena pura TaxID=153505 RepID=A0AAD6YF76_9AGAR|nr:acetyl-CoA synthetase-like protein [Mycena pura]